MFNIINIHTNIYIYLFILEKIIQFKDNIMYENM